MTILNNNPICCCYDCECIINFNIFFKIALKVKQSLHINGNTFTSLKKRNSKIERE